ncbi:T9SS type B sorting domain-containing protein [Fulvivirga sediminis]|uniref:Gliding motility-associated C-terminal domain-containing protein n=1 Tax=Fulvivirga sediminis TaxID=2803949 RepID=A0A937K0B2_9BACT|nr:gliding motility-associated C-terminal domain-containing protein [Fulvivirga sediminis]MBL3657489.1 gliding motility-associated C-terminal domain-containing protein [Fulvivirga sediminis]
MNRSFHYILLLFFITLVNIESHAQYKSVFGKFEVNEIKGCSPFTVSVRFLESCASCNDAIFYEYTYGDVNGTNLTSHTYTQPGVYSLKIFFTSGQDSVAIEVSDPTPPTFDIFKCNNNTIQVSVTDTRFDNYIINYGDGSPEVTVDASSPRATHSYANSSVRTVSVRGINDDGFDNCTSGTQVITPVTTLPAGAITSLEVIDETHVEFNYNLPENVLYQLYIKPNNQGTWQKYGKRFFNIDNQTATTGLRLKDNVYCFMLRAYNPCDMIYTTASNEICTSILSLSTESDVNKLSWTAKSPEVNFTLERSDKLSQPIDANDRSYSDTNISCGTEYCYQLVAHYNGGHTSRSASVCGTAFSNTPPEIPSNIATIVEGQSIMLKWSGTAGTNQYTILRGENNAYEPIGSSTTPSYADQNLNTEEGNYCYRLGITDNCGNSSPNNTNGVCSIFISGYFDRENTAHLSWNEYNGYANGVSSYLIEKTYLDGSSTTTDVGMATTYDNVETDDSEQVVIYRVIARPNDSFENSISNPVTLIKPNNIYFPNAFTPDQNGNNDTFRIHGKYITSFSLMIYNRWGELIFATDNMEESWDGTYNGKILPLGTYALVAEMTDMAGRNIKKTGTIMLLRR